MVSNEDIYITMSTIAVVSKQLPQQVTVDQKEFERVLKAPITFGQSSAGFLVSSQRDQIEVIAGGNKINVRYLGSDTDFLKSKIPEVLDFFTRQSKFKVSSYGVNFIVTVPCSKPAQWIRDNVLAADIPEKLEKTVMGGAAILNIESGRKTLNIKLDPSDDERLSVDFNASETTGDLPNQEGLRRELKEQFDELQKLLNNLGL